MMTSTPRYRIGNDMTVLWAINNKDGSPFDMSGKEVRLFITHRYGREEVACSVTRLPDGTINNVIRWDFSGDDQKVLGPYALTVRIFTSEDMKLIRKDVCEAFELVAVSCMECEEEGEAVINDGGELILSSKLDIYRFGIPKIYIGSNGNWFIDGVDTGRSALGGGPGLVSRIYGKSDFGGTFDQSSVVDTFNAHAINDLAERVKYMEGDDYLRLGNMTDVYFQGDLINRDILLFDGTYWTNVPLGEILAGIGGAGGTSGDYSELSRRIAVFEKMFYWLEEDETIGTPYNFFSENESSAGGTGESVGTGGGGGSVDLTGYATEEWVKDQRYLQLKDIAGKQDTITDLDQIRSNAAKGADAEGRVGTLEGYFTGSKAKNADKLDGHDSSYFASQTAVDGLSEIITLIKGWHDSVGSHFKYDKEADAWYLDGDFYTTGENSAAGAGNATEGGTGGLDEAELEEYLTDNGYATQRWVGLQGFAYSVDVMTLADRVTAIEAGGGTGSGDVDLSAYATKIWVENQAFAKKEDIPTNVSELTNDSGFITSAALEPYAKTEDIPTNVSELTNDSGFITSAALEPYAKTEDLQGLLSWYDAVGSHFKYDKESDAWYLDGDFYTTGENSAAGAGNAIEGGTGGLDEAELEEYLTDNGYAKKGDIPTKVSELINDAHYITSNDLPAIPDISSWERWYQSVGRYLSYDSASDAFVLDGDFYTTGENSAAGAGNATEGGTGGLDEAELEEYLTDNGYATQRWVKEQDYADAEDLNGKVDKESGKGLSSNDFTDGEKAKLSGLKNYDDTALKASVSDLVKKTETNAEGIATNAKNIASLSGKLSPLEEWYNAVGKYFAYDSESGAFKLTGDFYTTGENSAAGKGSEAFDLASVLERLTALEGSIAGKNLEIDFYELYGLQGTGISNAAMSNLVGLTDAAINGLLDGKYNKVIGKGTERQVWDYTAYETQQNIFIYFRRGDGFNTDDWYYLDYTKTTDKWNITFGEI